MYLKDYLTDSSIEIGSVHVFYPHDSEVRVMTHVATSCYIEVTVPSNYEQIL